MAGLITLVASACERRAHDFDNCPPGLVLRVSGDLYGCFCDADLDGDTIITDEEARTRPVISSRGALYQSCDTQDWVPEGYVFFIGPGFAPVPSICRVNGESNVFVIEDTVSCANCDCDGTCIGGPCLERCGAHESGCAPSEFCSSLGTCESCGMTRQCGAGCGPCLDGSMCVDGQCTGLVRCMVEPSGFCSESAPTWCPVSAAFFRPGDACGCDLTFPCDAATYRTQYYGSVEYPRSR